MTEDLTIEDHLQNLSDGQERIVEALHGLKLSPVIQATATAPDTVVNVSPPSVALEPKINITNENPKPCSFKMTVTKRDANRNILEAVWTPL